LAVCTRAREMLWCAARTKVHCTCVMKRYERIVEVQVREKVKIDKMQFEFMEVNGATDGIFIVRQLQENYMATKKEFGWHLLMLRKHLTEYLARSVLVGRWGR